MKLTDHENPLIGRRNGMKLCLMSGGLSLFTFIGIKMFPESIMLVLSIIFIQIPLAIVGIYLIISSYFPKKK